MKTLFNLIALTALTLPAVAFASQPTLIQEMALLTRQCAYQPYKLSPSGQKQFGLLRSNCPNLVIVKNTAQFHLASGSYAVIAEESEHADQGDLNDIYLQTSEHQGQAFEVQKNILSYSDPVIAVLMLAREPVESLPQVFDASL